MNWERFKDRVRVDTNHCSRYVNKPCASPEVFLTVHLPYESLRKWGDIRKKSPLFPSTGVPYSFIQLLNTFLFLSCGYRVRVNCQRVEKRLARACGEIKFKFSGTSGAAFRKRCQNDFHLALRFNEVVKVSEVESTWAAKKEKCEDIKRTNQQLNRSLSEVTMACKTKTETCQNWKARERWISCYSLKRFGTSKALKHALKMNGNLHIVM